MLAFDLIRINEKLYLLRFNGKNVSIDESFRFTKELFHIQNLSECSLIVDIKQISFLPSTFWSKMITCCQKTKKVIIVGLKGCNKQAFTVLGIDKLVFSASSIEEAQTLVDS